MDGSWTLETTPQVVMPAAEDESIRPARTETWTPERIDQLTRLWEAGVTTAEIGRRIGVTKNAVISKVHRVGLVPRRVNETPAPLWYRGFDFSKPICMWPNGHPGDHDFHFCGERPTAGRPYCAGHLAVAYISTRELKSEAA